MKASRLIFVLLIFSLLAACGSNVETTPTIDVNAMYTAAANTIVAEITKTADAFTPTPQPPTPTEAADTDTPTPDVTSTPLATATEAVCDDAIWVDDVTIPDGYNQLIPGQEFTKTWLIKNTGTCTWNANYQVVYGGYVDQMGGNLSNPIRVEVPPQAEVELSITLVAPALSGTYTGYWRMANATGVPFGEFFSVSIVIP